MPATTLDRRIALVVVDLRKGSAAIPSVHPVAHVAKNASSPAAAFRRHGFPAILANVAGGALGRTEPARDRGDLPADSADLLPELHRQPQDHVVTKRSWGAFTGTDLEDHLRDEGVTQVVLCGVAASIGVESTVRHAYELGFNVTHAVGAVTDVNADARADGLAWIFPRLGETADAGDHRPPRHTCLSEVRS
jgi:nicotinamidase-related amidase